MHRTGKKDTKFNSQEAAGHKMYKHERYPNALKAFRRAIKQTPNTSQKKGREKRKKRSPKGQRILRPTHQDQGTPHPQTNILETWTFYVSQGESIEGAKEIDADSEAFDAHFTDVLRVPGNKVLTVLQRVINTEPFQRWKFPSLISVHEGFRKARFGSIRVFWRMDEERRVIYFFARNRDKAYR